jgi:periplasmic divalent cation tolerance protein
MTTHFVYMTAKDRDEALQIGQALVNERLVACVNVFDNMTSLYWWNNSVQQESEAVLIAKASSHGLERLIARVRELHSYECPCIISWPISAGNPAYIQWIENETDRPTPNQG